MEPQAFFAKLDAIGEDGVRLYMAQGVYGEKKLRLVHEWLRRRQAAREVAAGIRDSGGPIKAWIQIPHTTAETEGDKPSLEERAVIAAEGAALEAKIANSLSERALKASRLDRTIAIIAVVIALIAAREDLIAITKWLLGK